MVREARLGAAQAGVVGAGFARLPIPQDPVATGAGHGTPATDFVEQTATPLAKT